MASESAGLPLNFYHGECSSYPEHSQEFTEDQKPVVGIAESLEPQHDLCLDKPGQYAVDSKPVKDGIDGEANDDRNPLNYNYVCDELYLDATDNIFVDDGSFLEANDLVNPVEPDPTNTDGADIDMPEEYLTYFDADGDILQYISFDSPEFTGTEDPVPDLGPPLTQQVRALDI